MDPSLEVLGIPFFGTIFFIIVLVRLLHLIRIAQRQRNLIGRSGEPRLSAKHERPSAQSIVSTFELPDLKRKSDHGNEPTPRVSGY